MTVEQKIERLIEEAEAQRFAGTRERGISADDFTGAARRDGYVEGLRADAAAAARDGNSDRGHPPILSADVPRTAASPQNPAFVVHGTASVLGTTHAEVWRYLVSQGCSSSNR